MTLVSPNTEDLCASCILSCLFFLLYLHLRSLSMVAMFEITLQLHEHWSMQKSFSCQVMSDSATPWTAACQASLCVTIFWSLLKLVFIESVMPSNHFILCCPLLLFLSIMIFFNESGLCIRWPKYWSFSISPSNEYSELISSRIDQFDLLAVQGTLESSLAPQFESINSLVEDINSKTVLTKDFLP